MLTLRAVSCPTRSFNDPRQTCCYRVPPRCSQQRTVCRSYYAERLLPAPRIQEIEDRVEVNEYDTQAPPGHKLSENKQHLQRVCQEEHVPDDRWTLMVAMAMQETNHMDVEERDRQKDDRNNDGVYDSDANASIFNLSKDLIEKSGFYSRNDTCDPGHWQALTNSEFDALNSNSEQSWHDAVGILNMALDRWGVEDTLAFVRQGGDAFDPYDEFYKAHKLAGQPTGWREYWAQKQFADPARKQEVYDQVVRYLGCIKRYLHLIDDSPDLSLRTNAYRPDINCKNIQH